ncbi:MFS general substrate transporter [Cylindrobasidium torrendii FP15055 ss-10]|uniref:MFS general substrate transporter n=1 Tax=Cylindrobasidium torrendii FP15055 ss-10 TaxID=1314674 RepID=A0A0D7BEW1_9AGAR|nr:MFS general substrate transporter [Cylindrobasidium torrendii FP15055 ss-10]
MERTPLPKVQLLMVYLLQLAEPITATVIYPFCPEAVRRTGITAGDETRTGYYAGIIESAFFLAECLTVYYWGRASDRYGRRPVLLLAPLGLAFAMVGFGLSTNFWFMVFFRCLQGIFNGNIGVAKTVIGEITDSTNIGDAFATMPLIWGLGSTAGPIIGGLLANPQEQWPIFDRLPFFHDHPYLLPCAVSGLFSFIIFIITVLFLNEKISNASTPLLYDETTAGYGTVEECTRPQTKPSQAPTLWEVANPRVRVVIGNYCVLAFVSASYEVLQPLMWSTSIPVGGLGLSPYEIGLIMFIWGSANAIVQVFVGSSLIRKIGAPNTFSVASASMLVSFIAFSTESYLARMAGYVNAYVGIAMGIQLFTMFACYSGYGSAHVLIVQTATSPATLGSTNGLAQMLSSGTRAFAPYLASSLFSVTLGHKLAGGFMVYFLYIFFMVILLWWTRSLKKIVA